MGMQYGVNGVPALHPAETGSRHSINCECLTAILVPVQITAVVDLGFLEGGVTLGTLLSLPFPSSTPVPSHPFLSVPSVPFPPLPLEVGPLNPARG